MWNRALPRPILGDGAWREVQTVPSRAQSLSAMTANTKEPRAIQKVMWPSNSQAKSLSPTCKKLLQINNKKNPKSRKKWAEIMNRKGNKNNAYIYKKCPVSLLTTERQIKTTLRDDLFIQWAKSKV